MFFLFGNFFKIFVVVLLSNSNNQMIEKKGGVCLKRKISYFLTNSNNVTEKSFQLQE